MNDLGANVKELLSSVEPRLRQYTEQAVKLELERLAGADVSLGEQALFTSVASVAVETMHNAQLRALRILLAAAKLLT